MADETIIIQYVVEADTAIQNAQRMREVINQSKEDIKRMVAESGASFKDIGKSLQESFKSIDFGTEGAKKIGDFLKIDPDTIVQQTEFVRARQEAIGIIRTATTELGKEERAQIMATRKAEQEHEQSVLAAATTRARSDRMAAAEAKAGQQEYERVTKQGYGVMSAEAAKYGQQVQAVKQQIVTQSQASGQTYQQTAQQMQAAGTSANVLNSALKQLSDTGNKTKTAMSSLGQTIQQALVIGLGLNLYNAIQSVIAFLREAAISGQELAKAFFQLEIGIRAVRRAGMDITTPEMLQNLDRLQEKFGVFSKKSLVEGSSALINLIRDMGMTKEQVFQLQDAIATLAVVNGRSMDDVQRTVALALSSGYTEGLQRLGVSINRVNIAARANAMGWKGGYTALTEHQRAMATLSLVMEKTGKYADDLAEYQKTLAGQYDISTAKLADQKALIGSQLLPTQVALNEALIKLIDNLGQVLEVLSPIVNSILAVNDAVKTLRGTIDDLSKTSPALKFLLDLFENLRKGVEMVLNPFKLLTGAVDMMRQNFQKLKDSDWGMTDEQLKKWQWLTDAVTKIFSLTGQQITLPEPEVGTPDLGMDELESQGKSQEDYVKKLHDDIENEQRRFVNRMAELERDLARDMADIDRDLARDLEDIARDLARDREKIIEDGNRKLTEAAEEYTRKVAEENRNYALKIQDSNRKYQQDELDAEKKHQEDMRRLREEFLFDLEDALHERDARQILTLTRRYNLDKEQGQRQFDLDREERARQHQLELEDLAREHEERMRQLAEEQAEKLAKIREETQLRLEERQRQYEQEVEDRNRKAEQDREDRAIKQQELIEDLKIQSAERLAELVAELAAEKDMTAAMLQGIADEYSRIYGPMGIIDQQMYYYISMLAQRAAEAQSIMKQMYPYLSGNLNLGGNTNLNNNNNQGGRPYNKFAEGGTMYADRPTSVIFGDKGLEKATFTPIGRTGRDEGKVVGGGDLVSGRSRDGKVTIAVAMEAGLIASIQENTLDKAAEVLFEVQRSH
jgi:hypothetical protein